ncbi:MAG: hypothetical protein WCK33_04925 [Phycisphaerae bacterium]|jgi:uncharacterized protein (TIGR03382 family)
MKFRNRIVGGIIGATLLGAAGQASAIIVLGNGDTVSLDAVLGSVDRTVRIEDKIFSFESYASGHFNPRDITMIGFVAALPNQYGFRNVGFDLTAGFGDGTPGDTDIHEANLQYTVSVDPAAYARGVRLCDARLTFNGSANGAGSYARVDETIFDSDANVLLGNLSVYDNAGPPRSTRLTDGADYCVLNQSDGYRAFEVNKDLKFFAASGNDTASASFVRQEFSQIPGPGALGALGAAGLVGLRRRRR